VRASVLGHIDWRCGRCEKSGRIQYVNGAREYEVLHILEDAHNEASPECQGDLRQMRVTPAPEAQSHD
jgi:hypothetical protein